MLSSFLTGFFLGISLIVAIGPQNSFVIRQGILGKHTFYVALFCAISDSLLICLGVIGISFFLNSFISEFSNLLFGLSSLWLFGYGVLRLKSAFKGNTNKEIADSKSKKLRSTILVLAILTFANPHVYLDTMVLIGSISQQFLGIYRITFAMGAIVASFVFFFCLGYGATKLSPLMKRKSSWQVLDILIAIIMFNIAFNLFFAINW